MAKINPNFRSKRGSTKRVGAKVIVHRTAERGANAFEACVRIGSMVKLKSVKSDGTHVTNNECAYGKNPRAAVANALVQYARALKGRKGAFRGVEHRPMTPARARELAKTYAKGAKTVGLDPKLRSALKQEARLMYNFARRGSYTQQR